MDADKRDDIRQVWLPSNPAAPSHALLFVTGHPGVDAMLRRTIERVETAVPGRVWGYHLGGSYAEGSAVAESDVDVMVVVRGACSAEESAALGAIAAEQNTHGPPRLDLVARSEDQLLREGAVGFKLGSRLVWGEDIRDRIAVQPLGQYLADVDNGCTSYMRLLRGNPPELPLSLGYPDPDDAFFGYLHYGILRANGWAPGTRTLVNCITLGATWFVGRSSGVQVGSKATAVRAHATHIGDVWSTFVEQLYRRCKLDWGYHLPVTNHDRAELRELCRRALAFERQLLEDIRSTRS